VGKVEKLFGFLRVAPRIEWAVSPGRARSPGLLKRPERELNLCQTIAVNFSGTPGMGRDKIGEIVVPLFQGEKYALIRRTARA
jgi:hypothetical protein